MVWAHPDKYAMPGKINGIIELRTPKQKKMKQNKVAANSRVTETEFKRQGK